MTDLTTLVCGGLTPFRLVNLATADGTAKISNSDYVATNGTLSFAPGQLTQTTIIAVKGDTSRESDETFFLNSISAVNASILDSQGVGLIQNDD